MIGVLEAARLTLSIGGPGLAVSAARDLRSSAEFRDDGMLSCRVAGTLPAPAATWVMPWERYRVALAAKFAAGVLSPAALAMPRAAAAALAWVLVATVLLTLYRSDYGLDGSDQMAALATMAAALALSTDTTTGRLFLGFLAAQLVLSYLIAGVAKLVSPEWRDGSCLANILSTTSYESTGLARTLTRWPLLARGTAWWVMLFEVLFVAGAVAGVVAGSRVLWLFVAAGLLMHLGIALTMRLTTFVFAFMSAYPALLVTAAYLHA